MKRIWAFIRWVWGFIRGIILVNIIWVIMFIVPFLILIIVPFHIIEKVGVIEFDFGGSEKFLYFVIGTIYGIIIILCKKYIGKYFVKAADIMDRLKEFLKLSDMDELRGDF